jgi:lipopolysaccharide export system permease protein
MNILRSYVVGGILKSVGLVLLVLVSVGGFIEFVGQLDDVGAANYGLPQAIAYVALRLPRLVFEVLPAAALLGALLSLGNLAVHRELVVMRASGVSQLRLFGAVGTAGLMLMVVMALLGESLAPSLGAYARELRAQALLDDVDIGTGQSAWLKDGNRIISLQRPGRGLEFSGGLYLFELGHDQSLRQVARADSAEIDRNNQWTLVGYDETTFSEAAVTARHERNARQGYSLSPDLLGLSEVREDLLDTPALKRYIEYLEANDLDADAYIIAYWTRVASVVSVVLMSVLALPFVLGSLRSAGAGARLVVGLVIGLGYYVGGQVLANSGQVYDLDPLVVAWAPIALLAAVTGFALIRVR